MIQLGEYTFQIADTDALREAAHRLRYQVYVEEYGFEKAADHPGGLEKDALDPHALPLVALDRKGGVVGTARLILRSPLGFPALAFADADKRSRYAPPCAVAEVSRLAMDKEFRGAALDFQREMGYYFRHLGGTRKRNPPFFKGNTEGIPRRLVVVLGLINLIYGTAVANGIDHLVMASEKSLWLLLRRFGLPWKPIGPETDYHGRRAPYTLAIADAAKPIGQFRKKIMDALLKQPPAPPRRFRSGIWSMALISAWAGSILPRPQPASFWMRFIGCATKPTCVISKWPTRRCSPEKSTSTPRIPGRFTRWRWTRRARPWRPSAWC